MSLPNVADMYSLTPMQQLMLLHALAHSKSDVLFNQSCYTLHGRLDAPAFDLAWRQLVDRHDVLRTGFAWQQVKQPLQIVRREAKPVVEHLDWREGAPPKDQLPSLLREDVARGFDLTRPPLMRVTLIRETDTRYTMVWSSHHLLMDRWCISIVLEELAQLYHANRLQRVASLGSAPQFRDYIAWLKRQDLARARDFWRHALNGLPSVDTQGTVRRTVASNSANGTRFGETQQALDASTSSRLRDISREQGLSINAMLLGLWGLALASHRGNAKQVCGLTVSGRPTDLDGAESMLGTFINNVPVYMDADDTTPMVIWLKDLQRLLHRLQPYSFASIQQIQQWTELRREPLFDNLLVFLSSRDSPRLCTDELEIQEVSGRLRTTSPLTLAISENESQMGLGVAYQYAPLPR